MEHTVNQITVRGSLQQLPVFSHENHGKKFYRFTLDVPRLSGAVDSLPVVVSEQVLNKVDLSGGEMLIIYGQVRSHNVRSDGTRHLLIFIYADNIIAETIGGQFTGGTCTLTVDGLLQNAERLIAGLPAPDTEGFLNYGNDQATPYVGIGFVMRYISGGVTSYAPVILTKAILNPQTLSGATQEESVDFQTQELEFALTRDANGVWKKVGDGLATEALAEAKIQTFFGITQG